MAAGMAGAANATERPHKVVRINCLYPEHKLDKLSLF